MRTLADPQFDHSTPELLRCEVEPERDAVRIRPVGSLDMATVAVLRAEIDELREAGFRHLILDLRRLDFMDSTGLRLMLAVHAEAGRDGCSIALVPGPRAVQQVFELTGTHTVLPFVAR